MIQEKLFGLGIPTYTCNIYTAIPATASENIPIGKQLPQQIGRIYGMAIYADGVTSDRKDLITTTDAQNLYLTLKIGAEDFLDTLRLSDMLSMFTGIPIQREFPFLPVNVPNGIDLSTSSYANPTGILAGANNKTICLKLWYISNNSYNTMLQKGIVLENAKPLDK